MYVKRLEYVQHGVSAVLILGINLSTITGKTEVKDNQ